MKTAFYLEPSSIRGGIEIFAERHAARLRAAGDEVEVASALVCRDAAPGEGRGLFLICDGRPLPVSGFDEIVVHKCSDVATLALFPPEKTVYYIHDHEPICPRTYAYTPLKRNCTRPGGVWPCLFCAPLCRNWRPALRRVLSQARRKRVMAGFKRLVVISEFMKGRLVANGLPAEKIAVEPPRLEMKDAGCASPEGACVKLGEAAPQYGPQLEQGGPSGRPAHAAPAPQSWHQHEQGGPSGRPTPAIDLLFAGQLIRGKGVQLLLAAMARMKTPRTLDIVGTGNMEPKLKALAARLGIAGRVRFNGFQANPRDWMLAAKCVVVPSFWQEPYGLVAAEAVALGRPVVAFAIGGLPEACGGKATLVPAGDVDALAAALDKPAPQGD